MSSKAKYYQGGRSALEPILKPLPLSQHHLSWLFVTLSVQHVADNAGRDPAQSIFQCILVSISERNVV